MKKLLGLALAGLLTLVAGNVAAQTPTPPPYSILGGSVPLAVTNSSANVALPASTTPYGAITVYNSGSVDAYIALGGNAVVATTGGTCTAAGGPGPSCLVRGGSAITIWAGSSTYVAAITSASTTTLTIYQASGPVSMLLGPGATAAVNGTVNTGVTPGVAYYAANGNAVSDGGSASVKMGVALGGTGSAPNPTFTSSADPNTGFYFNADHTIRVTINGTQKLQIGSAGQLTSVTSSGFALLVPGATATVPTLVPNQLDGTTGLGGASGHFAAIAGGVNQIDCISTGCTFANAMNTGAITVASGQTVQTPFLSATTQIQNAAAGPIFWTGRAALLSPADGVLKVANNAQTSSFTVTAVSGSTTTFQHGAADAASPVAQTVAFQNVVAGTTNTAGANATINPSIGTGTGVSGNIVFNYASHDVTHAVTGFTGSASPYTITFTPGNITNYPTGTVMTVASCSTATLNGTYTVTSSSSGQVVATTSATGTGSPTNCTIVGNTQQNALLPALTINGDTGAVTLNVSNSGGGMTQLLAGTNSFNGSMAIGSSTPSNASAYFYRGSDNAAINVAGALGIGWAPSTNPTATTDTVFFRQAAGVVEIGTSATPGAQGSLLLTNLTNSGALIAGGSAPTATGTCTRGAQVGGNTSGSIVLTCTSQTVILTFSTTAPHGWLCDASDQTTIADNMKQTANSTTSCTLTGTTAASDVVLFHAVAF